MACIVSNEIATYVFFLNGKQFWWKTTN